MKDWSDPAVAEQLIRVVNTLVDRRLSQAMPKKRYGKIVRVNSDRTVHIQFGDAEEVSTGWQLSGFTPTVGQRVRVIEWPGMPERPDGDRYVDSVVGEDG